MQISKRLFVTMDAEHKLALDRDEVIEYIEFMKENMYHAEYKADQEKKAIEAMYDSLPKKEVEVTIINPYKPKEKRTENQMRVEFDPLHEMILKEAKEDGCIWIPYEVTEAENKKKKEEEAKNGGSKTKKEVEEVSAS